MCKKIMYLILFVTFAFSTTAMADIAISTQANWWPQADADRETQEIVDNVTKVPVELFTSAQHPALATWVTNHTNNGSSDLLILCGIFPASIYPAANAQPDGSIAELFLDAGNVIINTGDYMFYVSSGANNDAGGLQNMMDIPAVDMWGDNTAVTVTADGQLYTPTLANFQTDRPFHSGQLAGTDWSYELVLAQNAGGDADPVIVLNSVTNGRVGIFYQTADQGNDPRGEVISEWINNWYLEFVALDNQFAADPDPADGAVDVSIDTNLTWTRGAGAKWDQVYFGTDPCDANLALVDTLMVGVDPAEYDPGDPNLLPSTTYYWYVTEVNAPNEYPGDLWSFTTIPGEAQCQYPIDGTVIPGDPYPPTPSILYTELIFNPGPTAVKHTGYLSKDPDKVANRAQD
ncbi:MAG: hypothetical protein ACYSUY_04935, partial [Planctomycetota bacterium]